jgi:CO/xanthine dehydrogenase FAD-binding subunit
MPFYYKKVGGRSALDISRIAFAGTYEIQDGVLTDISVAVIGAGMFQRFRDIEAQLTGKPVSELRTDIDKYVKLYSEKMKFTRGRVSAEYRQTVALNLLRDFLTTVSA